MHSSQSLAHDAATLAGWALCASALDALGYDLERSLAEPELRALAPSHSALWAALELALLPAADAGRSPHSLPRELIEPLRDLPLLESVEAFASKPGAAAELRRSLALEIGRAREAGVLAVRLDAVPSLPAAGCALDAFLGELGKALAEQRLVELALWLSRPRVAERLSQVLALILVGALRASGVVPRGSDPLPHALETAASPSARAALFELVAACERAARASDAVPKSGGTQPPTGTQPASVPDKALPEAVRKGDDVQFTVYRPRSVAPRVWSPMLAFAHLAEKRPDAPKDAPDPLATVKKQAEVLLGADVDRFQSLSEDASQPIPFEGQLSFVPEVAGVEFDPPQASFRWIADVHRVEFKLRADASLAGSTARGRLTVLLGSLIVAELALSLRVSASEQAPTATELESGGSARMYRKIFASYSHKDGAIVAQFRELAKALGDRYLIDVSDLRAGERWSEALEALIREADLFQLFWSWNSIRSPYVRREWEYALSLDRRNFLRPTYWEHPMPKLPDEDLPPQRLRELHFQALNPTAGRPEPAPEPTAEPAPAARARPRLLRWAVPVSSVLAAAAAFMLFLRTGAEPDAATSVAPSSSPEVTAPATATPERPTASESDHGAQSNTQPTPPPPPPPPPASKPHHPASPHGRLGADGMTAPRSPSIGHGNGYGRGAGPVGEPETVEALPSPTERDQIDQLIAQQRAGLQACAAAAPSAAAQPLELHLRVLPSGEPRAEFPGGTSPLVRACIEARVRRWRFATASTETLREVRLQPTGRPPPRVPGARGSNLDEY